MAIIESNLDGSLMRNKMESKEALAQKGALYVGTGVKTTVPELKNGENVIREAVEVPMTTFIAPAQTAGGGIQESESGKVLIVDPSTTEGWKIAKITASNIEDGAVSPTKLNLQSDYAVKTLTVHATNSLDEQFAKYTDTGIEYAGINDSLNTLVYPTELPDKTGTVATKEQIESGEIVAKNAANAANAVNAEKTSFSNGAWQVMGDAQDDCYLEKNTFYYIKFTYINFLYSGIIYTDCPSGADYHLIWSSYGEDPSDKTSRGVICLFTTDEGGAQKCKIDGTINSEYNLFDSVTSLSYLKIR